MITFEPYSTLRPLARNETVRDTGREFVRLVGPVVYALARRQGFDDAEAAALMRDALTRAARVEKRTAGGADRDGIPARLITATQTALAVVRSAKEDRLRRADDGSAAALELGHALNLDADWEGEFQRQLTRTAMSFVECEFAPRDWQAFWRTAVDGRTGTAVGRELGMTAGTVHVVKCRALSRLREEVGRLQREAESWDRAAARNADQPRDAAVQAPDPEDIDRTSLHVPRFLRQG